jgi:DNA-binding GntR family transcriptional regulator
VVAEITRMILAHEIGPGAPIRQEEIALKLGVSRVPVREALMVLEARGQVDYTPHFGFSVPKLSSDELVEIYLIREKLEELALSRTVQVATEQDIENMREALESSDAALASGDLIDMTRSNRDFHFALFEPSGMHRLTKILGNLWDTMAAYRPTSYMDGEDKAQISQDHHDIFAAIRDKDAERALASLVNHRSSLVNSLRRAVEDTVVD